MAIALRKLGLLSEENHQRLQPDAASLRWVSVATGYLLPPSANLLSSFFPSSLSPPSFLPLPPPSFLFLSPSPPFLFPSLHLFSLPSLLYSSSLSLHLQKDLLAMLISQTDISQPDLTSSVYEAVGKDDVIMKAIKEYVVTTCHYIFVMHKLS